MWECSELRLSIMFVLKPKNKRKKKSVKCSGTFYDTMQAEKVTTISAQPKATIVADWLKPKVYKGEDEEVQF